MRVRGEFTDSVLLQELKNAFGWRGSGAFESSLAQVLYSEDLGSVLESRISHVRLNTKEQRNEDNKKCVCWGTCKGEEKLSLQI